MEQRRKLERSDTGFASVDISQYTSRKDGSDKSPSPQPTLTDNRKGSKVGNFSEAAMEREEEREEEEEGEVEKVVEKDVEKNGKEMEDEKKMKKRKIVVVANIEFPYTVVDVSSSKSYSLPSSLTLSSTSAIDSRGTSSSNEPLSVSNHQSSSLLSSFSSSLSSSSSSAFQSSSSSSNVVVQSSSFSLLSSSSSSSTSSSIPKETFTDQSPRYDSHCPTNTLSQNTSQSITVSASVLKKTNSKSHYYKPTETSNFYHENCSRPQLFRQISYDPQKTAKNQKSQNSAKDRLNNHTFSRHSYLPARKSLRSSSNSSDSTPGAHNDLSMLGVKHKSFARKNSKDVAPTSMSFEDDETFPQEIQHKRSVSRGSSLAMDVDANDTFTDNTLANNTLTNNTFTPTQQTETLQTDAEIYTTGYNNNYYYYRQQCQQEQQQLQQHKQRRIICEENQPSSSSKSLSKVESMEEAEKYTNETPMKRDGDQISNQSTSGNWQNKLTQLDNLGKKSPRRINSAVGSQMLLVQTLQPGYEEIPSIVDISRRHRRYLCLTQSRSEEHWSDSETEGIETSEISKIKSNEHKKLAFELKTADPTETIVEDPSSDAQQNIPRSNTQYEDDNDAQSVAKIRRNNFRSLRFRRHRLKSDPSATNMGWDSEQNQQRGSNSRSNYELDLAQRVLLRHKVLRSMKADDQ